MAIEEIKTEEDYKTIKHKIDYDYCEMIIDAHCQGIDDETFREWKNQFKDTYSETLDVLNEFEKQNGYTVTEIN